jgi:hypothetical protein
MYNVGKLDDSLSHTGRDHGASVPKDDSFIGDAQLVDERSVVGQLSGKMAGAPADALSNLAELGINSSWLLATCSRVMAGSKALWTTRVMYCSLFFSSRWAFPQLCCPGCWLDVPGLLTGGPCR